ncbi:MAG: type I DNA topoisomerase [Candidatus Omnitrophica bacterium]|nr:type I DNA topoisomerase [Candidatus Omnitrophota bacterium]
MSKKSIVIVESPAKARTISKFLGDNFSVVSSMGHIVDLPQKKLGVEIDKDYKAEYVVIPGKKKLLSELKKNAKTADAVYFATDPDREGEAIGWNLKEWMDLKKQKVFRVEFHEITKAAIDEAFRSPRCFNEDRIRAQQARRILDRIVGYFLSPLLWRKVTRGLSAGRVQSVALRLIVEREKEIQAFVPQEYWSIDAELKKHEGSSREKKVFKASLEKIDGRKIQITSEEEARKIVADLEGKDYKVESVDKTTRSRSPLPPFITSTLQQDAFNKLRYSATKTMFIAQQLYEGIEVGEEGPVGLITYMRTDSTQVAQTALKEVRSFISSRYGAPYLPESPRVYKSRKLAQEAHEAIRPTSVQRSPKDMEACLTPEQFKLYELIWKRFVASQMNPAQMEQTSVVILADGYSFKATGSRTVFDGFSVLYKSDEDAEEESKKELPPLAQGELLSLQKLEPGQHFTKPPARYSEGSLIKALEEDGVGRPSTYAPTISTLVSRDYVRREKGYLLPTELGVKVSELLVGYFPQVMDITFTAHMEEELDMIEDGKADWVKILNEFYAPFKEKLDFAAQDIKKEVIYSDEICDKCGKPMVIKWGRKGKFLSCSDYPTCKNAKSISSGVKCPAPGCGGDLILRRSYRGRSFYGCSNYPKCTFTSQELPSTDGPPAADAQDKSALPPEGDGKTSP